MKRVVIASLTLWLANIACCSLLEMGDSRREIVGGYCTISGSSISLRGIVECKDNVYVILPNVVEIDWNEEFIVAKRDKDELDYGVEELSNVSGRFEWYIIDVGNHVVLGPYPYNEYLVKRYELAVPSTIRFLEEK